VLAELIALSNYSHVLILLISIPILSVFRVERDSFKDSILVASFNFSYYASYFLISFSASAISLLYSLHAWVSFISYIVFPSYSHLLFDLVKSLLRVCNSLSIAEISCPFAKAVSFFLD